MGNLKIGVASVTFREKTVEQVIEIAKSADVNYIEWGGDIHVKSLDEARKAKELCDKNNITISSYGSYYTVGSKDKSEWKKICRIANTMGASSVRVWLGKKDSEKTSEEEYETLVSDLKSMCSVAKEYDLLVCPECHDNTFNNSTDAIIKLKNELNADNFKTYFQSRYFRFDYDIDRIERTYSFIENVHVSYRDLKKEQLFRKKDKLYLHRLLEKFVSMNFDGIVMVEFVDDSSEIVFANDVNKLKSY